MPAECGVPREVRLEGPVTTGVRRIGPGRWLATCDCGQASLQLSHEDGWEWVIEHSCAAGNEP